MKSISLAIEGKKAAQNDSECLETIYWTSTHTTKIAHLKQKSNSNQHAHVGSLPSDLSGAFSQPKKKKKHSLHTFSCQQINYANATLITEVISNKKEMNYYYLPNFLFC
jgi:hypothetical protein